MKSVGLVVISVLALLVACGGGSGPAPIPPPDEIGPRVATVNHAVWENDAALKDPVEDHLDTLESTIATIVEAHGEQSVEAVQALQETSTLLASARRWDLALPFMERALALSREVYGVDHRETAFALNDVAVLLTKIAPDGYDPRAELLFQGAVDVRRRRAGIDQPETAVSEADLAWQLMLGAGRESLPHRKYPLLVQAEQLALHAQRVLDEHKDSTNRMLIRRTLVETAFARADYSEVQKRARALLEESDYDKGPGLYPDATAQDLLAKAIELQADLFKDVELPKARGLQDSRHEHAN